jgi:hypothetical protein
VASGAYREAETVGAKDGVGCGLRGFPLRVGNYSVGYPIRQPAFGRIEGTQAVVHGGELVSAAGSGNFVGLAPLEAGDDRAELCAQLGVHFFMLSDGLMVTVPLSVIW